MTPQARAIIDTVAAQRGVAASDIAQKCRRRAVVLARVEVSRQLHARGYSSPRIGQLLNHDHTTILFYLGRIRHHPAPVARWHAPVIKQLKCYTPVEATEPPPPPKPVSRADYLVPYAGADSDYVWKKRREK